MKVFVLLVSLLAVASANPTIGGRVSDGLNATPGQAPYACSLRWGITNRSHSCGATLLTDSWFLAAAHCFSGVGAGTQDIQCGVTNRVADISTQQVRTWTESDVIYHPGWTGSIYSDDIVLVRVSEPFALNDLVRPVRLRVADHIDHQNVARLFGWGSRSGPSATLPEVLQTAEMDTYNAATCRERMGAISSSLAGFITDNDLCAGRGSYSMCSGDSGGPLVRQENGVDIMIGMAVWGLSPCGATADAPSVFSRVSAYTSWIEAQVGQSLS